MVINGGIVGVGFCNLVEDNKKNKKHKNNTKSTKSNNCHSIIHILDENLENANIKFITKNGFDGEIIVNFKSGNYETQLLKYTNQHIGSKTDKNIQNSCTYTLITATKTEKKNKQLSMDYSPELPQLDAQCQITEWESIINNKSTPPSIFCHDIVFAVARDPTGLHSKSDCIHCSSSSSNSSNISNNSNSISSSSKYLKNYIDISSSSSKMISSSSYTSDSYTWKYLIPSNNDDFIMNCIDTNGSPISTHAQSSFIDNSSLYGKSEMDLDDQK